MGIDSTLVTVLINAGTAGVVVILMLLGWLVPRWVHNDLRERLQLKEEECTAERERADAAVAAAQGARDVMAAVQLGLQMAHGDGSPREIAPGGSAL
jgi:hypothetical protein